MMRAIAAVVCFSICAACAHRGDPKFAYARDVGATITAVGVHDRREQVCERDILFSNIGITFCPQEIGENIVKITRLAISNARWPESWPDVAGSTYTATYKLKCGYPSFEVRTNDGTEEYDVHFTFGYLVSVRQSDEAAHEKLKRAFQTRRHSSFELFPVF